MFIRIPGKSIKVNWEPIEKTLNACLPPIAPGRMITIKDAMVRGDMQCWILADDKKNALAMTVTSVYNDRFTNVKGLLLYALYVGRTFSKSLSKEWANGLRKFADENGCIALIKLAAVEGV